MAKQFYRWCLPNTTLEPNKSHTKVNFLHLFYNNAEGWVNMSAPITLNKYGSGLSNKIDVVSDSYYNQGFTNFSLSIES